MATLLHHVWSTYGRGGGRGATGAGVGEAGTPGPCTALAENWRVELKMNLREDWSFTGSPTSALTFNICHRHKDHMGHGMGGF